MKNIDIFVKQGVYGLYQLLGKTIEIRPDDDAILRGKKPEIGDHIFIRNGSGGVLKYELKCLKPYNSLKELLKKEPLSLLASGYKNATEVINFIRSAYRHNPAVVDKPWCALILEKLPEI